jgi:hypothetical protein
MPASKFQFFSPLLLNNILHWVKHLSEFKRISYSSEKLSRPLTPNLLVNNSSSLSAAAIVIKFSHLESRAVHNTVFLQGMILVMVIMVEKDSV